MRTTFTKLSNILRLSPMIFLCFLAFVIVERYFIRKLQNSHIGSTAYPKLRSGKIKVSPSEIDFGNIPQGDTKTKVLLIENVGNIPLRIYRIKSSCGCITEGNCVGALSPGEKRSVLVKLTTTSREAGKHIKQIWIDSSDEESPRLSIPVKAYVVPKFSVTTIPDVINFGNIAAAASRHVMIYWPAGKNCIVRDIVSSSELLTCHVITTGKSLRNAQKLLVKLDAAYPAGKIAEKIHIETSTGSCEIPVLGFKLGMVTWMPKTLIFKPSHTCELIARRIYVRGFGQEALRIISVTDNNGYMDVSVTETDPGKKFEILVRPTAELPLGFWKGYITVSTNLSSPFRIEYYGYKKTHKSCPRTE